MAPDSPSLYPAALLAVGAFFSFKAARNPEKNARSYQALGLGCTAWLVVQVAPQVGVIAAGPLFASLIGLAFLLCTVGLVFGLLGLRQIEAVRRQRAEWQTRIDGVFGEGLGPIPNRELRLGRGPALGGIFLTFALIAVLLAGGERAVLASQTAEITKQAPPVHETTGPTWIPFRSDTLGFSVSFPGKAVTTEKVEGTAPDEIIQHMHARFEAGTQYLVVVAQTSATLDETVSLEAAKNHLSARLKPASVATDDVVDPSGARGVRVRGELPEGQRVVSIFYATKNTVVQVACVSARGMSPGENEKRFFDSFTLLKRSPTPGK